MEAKHGSVSLCNQNLGVHSVNRHTDTQTDRQKSKIMSNNIHYIQIVIIVGSIFSSNLLDGDESSCFNYWSLCSLFCLQHTVYTVHKG